MKPAPPVTRILIEIAARSPRPQGRRKRRVTSPEISVLSDSMFASLGASQAAMPARRAQRGSNRRGRVRHVIARLQAQEGPWASGGGSTWSGSIT